MDKTPQKDESPQNLSRLREAELLYHTVFNQIPDGILIIDTNGRFIDFNEAAHRKLGYTRAEFSALSLSDIDPDQTSSQIAASISQVLEKGSAEFDVRHRTKEGELRDVHVFTHLMDLSGRPVFHTIWRDVTEHKRADEELRKSNANLRTLIDAIPDLVLFKDLQGRNLVVNKAVEQSLGLPREALIGRTNRDLLPAEMAAICTASDQAAMAAGKPIHAEERSKGRDGEALYLDTIKAPIRDTHGKVVGLVAVSRDITERICMEEALRKNEKFIRDILETVDEGFIVIDREYRIQSVNKAYLAQVGLPLESVVGRHCYEVSHHFDAPCSERGEVCSVKHTFATGEPFMAMHVHYDQQKNPLYVETKSYPLKDAGGETINAIEIINNVTEKKKLEEQLRHSQKLEAVGQLAGGVAHDFNNILTAITGYGSLIKMKMAEDDPQRGNLQQMLDAAERATSLTRGLLAFSRKQVISPRPVDLNEIIRAIEKLLRRLISEDIQLAVSLTREDLIIMADQGQIEQVLMNLATNAHDAIADRGCLTIRTDVTVLDREFVKTHGYGQHGPYALLSVTDTGAGMDEGTRERIFEPFFTTKEPGKGTGLGLSIVYGIVKQHNGYITCYSESGKGTTFKIYLPMINRALDGEYASAPLQAPRGTETVLIGEDDAAVRRLEREVLEHFGYRVLEAADGEECLRMFNENREAIRLLLLDVIMPKKNGKEVYDAVRADNPDVRFVFSSGYTADILERKGILEEHLHFISKPVSPTELLKTVRAALDSR